MRVEAEEVKVGLAGRANKLLPLTHRVHGRLRVEQVKVTLQLQLVQLDRDRPELLRETNEALESTVQR